MKRCSFSWMLLRLRKESDEDAINSYIVILVTLKNYYHLNLVVGSYLGLEDGKRLLPTWLLALDQPVTTISSFPSMPANGEGLVFFGYSLLAEDGL